MTTSGQRAAMMIPDFATVAEEARAQADAAAARHGVRVVELVRAAEHHAAAALFARIWRAESVDTVINAGLLTALAHADGYVVGVYRGDELVGGAVGLRGADHLHSHLTGVDQSGRGLGVVVKQHQRAWCLVRGIPSVRWTFDPLVARNAYFNLHRLGARAVEYLPDFYGPLDDGLNAGDATDRLYIRWDLASPAAIAAARGRDVPAPDGPDAVTVVDRAPDEPDRPVSVDPPGDGRPLRIAVPADIESLRGRDPELAAQWRLRVRAAMVAALSDGYRIAGISRDGFYTLRHYTDPNYPQGTDTS
jgi:predicted GNAT superfamily acetyltransferase